MSRSRWSTRAVPLLLSFALTAPSVAVAQGIEEPRIPLRTALAELSTLRTEYVDAFNRKDAAAVASMYDSDATLISDQGSMKGGEAIREMMTTEAPTWPHAVIASDTVRVYGNTAVDVGTWTVHPADGGEMVMRYMSVLRRSMSGWKLVSVAVVPAAAE